MLAAMSAGFVPCKPMVDNCKYDVVIERGGRCWRVQVKTFSESHWKDNRRFARYSIKRCSRSYVESDMDILAVSVSGVDGWLLIPSAEIAGKSMLTINESALRHLNNWEVFNEDHR